MVLHYKPHLKKYARVLRKNLTDAELKLWSRVRRKQLHGAQFYRQVPIEGYIVDFLCPSAKLIVELDGGQHRLPEQMEMDQRRDSLLADLGYKVLRFDDRETLINIQGVLETIYKEMDRRSGKSPLSSP